MQAIPVWVSWAASGTCVSVTSRRRDLSWCHGRDASMAGGGEGVSYQYACRRPLAGPVWELQAVGRISLGVAAGMRQQRAEERGEATSVRVVGRRWDLCECRCCCKQLAGSVLDPWCSGWDVDGRRRRKSWSLEVAAAQPGDLEILVLLNRTPKRRHFDARSIKTISF